MPEYLAPGVYVEETSFRAKAIEGVSTSTTAFVGPACKGPIVARGDTTPPPPRPELLTSFGDYVRLYGGLEPLGYASNQPNYLAHAVLNYFNEGGSRLYVLRVAQDAKAASVLLAGPEEDPGAVVIRARFPGSAGNGVVSVSEILSAATGKMLATAPEGTLLRARGAEPAEPARLLGTKPGPFAVHNGGVLRLLLADGPLDLTFRGQAAEAKAARELAATVTLTDTNHTLTVSLDGQPQKVTLTNSAYTPAQLALALNAQLTGGYARLDGNTLVLGTDRLGHQGRVQVAKNDDLGFTEPVDETAAFDLRHNNVGNLAAVTVADLRMILGNDRSPAEGAVIASEQIGRLALATRALGETATLAVADATDAVAGIVSEHNAFGLDLPRPGAPPVRGSNVRLYQKLADASWQAADGTPLLPLGDPAAEAGSFIALTVVVTDASGNDDVLDDVSLVRGSPRYLGNLLARQPSSRTEALRNLVWFDLGAGVNSLQLHAALFAGSQLGGDLVTGLRAAHQLQGGDDGAEPVAGAPDQDGTYSAAFAQLSSLEDVSIVAAPGHSSFAVANYQAVQGLIIQHVEKPRAYRIAVLDTPPNQTPGQARLERARIDSHRAALYYPWVTVANPLARPGSTQPREIDLPPSGLVCGIYARNDVERGVAKAPANEVVRSALRFERDVNFAENQLLNPLGVNCLRFFPGRGYRVWGARTASSDPEWKHVNVRRYFNYLEASVDRGTQWAVFENNGERLWANVRDTVESFLSNEWTSGNLLGATPKEAYFVRCDRSTMSQNDLDNGRLICLVGVAVLKPAEFVIFRIGQKTADARG